MAENTTKDIWNDDDGDRAEPKKRRHLLRNFLIFLLVLIVVLGIVLAAATAASAFPRHSGSWPHR